jgi:hypothetical protein
MNETPETASSENRLLLQVVVVAISGQEAGIILLQDDLWENGLQL